MYKSVRSSLLVAAVATVLSACSGPGGGRGGPGGPGDKAGAGGCRTLVEQSREQFVQTARALALTPTQQVLWEDYEESVAALISDQLRVDGFNGARRGALQQIDVKIDAARQRIALMEKLALKAATLYQSLDEQQKRVADRQLAATVPDLYSGSVCLAGNGGGEGGGGGPGGGARGK